LRKCENVTFVNNKKHSNILQGVGMFLLGVGDRDFPFARQIPVFDAQPSHSPRSDLGEIFALVGLTPTPNFGVGVEKANFL
jgi:hypothetical protein